MNFKAFLKTIAAAAISGAVTSTAAAVSDPANLDPTKIGTIAVAGAIVGAAGYLTHSPRKPREKKPKN